MISSLTRKNNTQYVNQICAVAFFICIFVVLALPAFATDRYFGLAGGAWLPGKTSSFDVNFYPVKVDYKSGWSAGGTFGVAFDSGMRLDNEIVYRQSSARSSSDDQWALGWLINIWWDARNSSPLTPYFGGGFGYCRGSIASPGPIEGSGTGVAYQAGGGVDVRLQRGFSLDLGYRYFGIADLASNNNVGDGFDLAGSSIMAGLRMRF